MKNKKYLNLDITDFPSEFDWYNDQFPPLDAITYWDFLKSAKKVIEVGCGYSSILPYKANVELICIDPNPRITYPNITYIREEVQKMPLSMFQELNEGDILFIDSSHIYKEGSDVHFLIHEVIPTLKDGVLFHFHDYFGGDGYPSDWQEHHEMKHWNENDKIIELALNSDFGDFEDAIQYYCAIENGIKVLITRNLKDFKHARIPVLTAEEFVKQNE
jgi:hypothetical protein